MGCGYHIFTVAPKLLTLLTIKQLGNEKSGYLSRTYCNWLVCSLIVCKHLPELGSGCGLTGIVAAHYAQMVYLTDYIPQVTK